MLIEATRGLIDSLQMAATLARATGREGTAATCSEAADVIERQMERVAELEAQVSRSASMGDRCVDGIVAEHADEGARIAGLEAEVAQLRAALVEAGRCRECEGSARLTIYETQIVCSDPVEVPIGDCPCESCDATGIDPSLSPATQAVVAKCREETK
jgi:hypothetical protein